MTNERHEFLEPNEPYFPFPSKEQDETNYTNDVFPFFNGYMPSYLDDNMNLEEFKINLKELHQFLLIFATTLNLLYFYYHIIFAFVFFNNNNL